MRKKKIIFLGIFFLLCLTSGLGTGYLMKANNNLLEEVSALYYNINTKLDTQYLEPQQNEEYKKLLEEKEQAFQDKNVEKLKDIQQKVLELQKSITNKKEQAYTERKTNVDLIIVSEAAIDEEKQNFEALKTEILKLIQERRDLGVIDQKIEALKLLVQTINESINKRQEEAEANAAIEANNDNYEVEETPQSESEIESTSEDNETDSVIQ